MDRFPTRAKEEDILIANEKNEWQQRLIELSKTKRSKVKTGAKPLPTKSVRHRVSNRQQYAIRRGV